MHMQQNIVNWTDGIIPAPLNIPQVVVAVDRGDLLVEAKRINPSARTVLRHCDDGMQVFSPTWEGAVELAHRWWSSFIDDTFCDNFAGSVDFVKGYNETLANSQNEEEVRQRVLMERALAHVWNMHYRILPEYEHIRPVLASAAVGNDIPERIARVAIEHDAVLSYHAYMYHSDGVRPDWEEQYLSGRWWTMEQEWDSVKPTWIFTEGGPFESAVTGWRSLKCLNGIVDNYVGAMRTQFREIKATAAWSEGRVLGPPVWFTTGGGERWRTFETAAPQLEALANMLADEWEKVKPGEMPTKDKIALWEQSIDVQVATGLQLNPAAAIQKEIFADGFVPVTSEFDSQNTSSAYVAQAAEHLAGKPRRLYVWLHNKVQWITEPMKADESSN